ncbi:MAG: hypothetical protein AB1651_04000 [Pseudomonadota bacterium]
MVTRNGVPIAELRPVQPRRFVPRAVIVEAAAHAARIDAKRFRTDLDTVIDPSVGVQELLQIADEMIGGPHGADR